MGVDEYNNILKILDSSVVVDDNSSDVGIGQDMKEMSGQITDDKNVFRFSNMPKIINFDHSMLMAIADKPNYPDDVKQRYSFLGSFLFHYNVGRGAIKGNLLDKYTEMVGSLIAFRGALEWRQAGVSDMQDNVANKKGFVDRLRRG